jgi:hypothetical protein
MADRTALEKGAGASNQVTYFRAKTTSKTEPGINQNKKFRQRFTACPAGGDKYRIPGHQSW